MRLKKTEFLVIRLSPPDRDLIAAAAAAEDLDLSTWARRIVLKAARKLSERSADRLKPVSASRDAKR
jgi:uncharacterized protein (DUF1778 family)